MDRSTVFALVFVLAVVLYAVFRVHLACLLVGHDWSRWRRMKTDATTPALAPAPLPLFQPGDFASATVEGPAEEVAKLTTVYTGASFPPHLAWRRRCRRVGCPKVEWRSL